MRDITLGLDLLIRTIDKRIKHPHYDRVTELADMYLKLFTGENLDDLMVQFTTRESKEMFDQRKRLYTSVMPAVANNLETVFLKPLRSNRIYAVHEHASNDITTKLQEIKKNFWKGDHDADSGLDAYLIKTWVRHAEYDPNAFIVVGFHNFNNLKEKPQSYPIEYSSTDAWNYEYINGTLDYLMIHKDIKYARANNAVPFPSLTQLEEMPEKDGEKFLMYLEDDVLVATQVDYDDPDLTQFGRIDQILDINKRKYVLEIFNTKSGQVPAIRSGVRYDRVTKDATCVSIFHPAVAFFKKELKSGSELDITMAAHVFPQKLQYGQACEGDQKKGKVCKEGKEPISGKNCTICGGSGISKIHNTAQDVILVKPPKPGETPLDLEKMLVYKAPSVELVQFMDTYVDRLTDKARKAIFAGEALIRTNIQTTATEKEYNMDDVYDALSFFTKKYSSVWLFSMRLSAQYIDANNDQLKLYHKFPHDPKLKPQSMVVKEFGEAKEAGLPGYLLESYSNDIADMMYADDQDTLFKLKIRKKFNPFTSKTPEEISILFSLNKVPQFDQILYANFDMIFTQIDEELGMRFYLRPYKAQLQEITTKVEAIIAKLDKETAKRVPINIEGDDIKEFNEDTNNNSDASDPNKDDVKKDDSIAA